MKLITRLTLILSLILSCGLVLSLANPALAQGETPPDIDGDQVVIGNAFRLKEYQKLNGDLAVMGGSAVLEVNSVTNGNVAVLGGSLQIDGKVNGDVVAVGGQVSLSDSAVVNGNVIVPIALLSQSSGATVNGDVITNSTNNWSYIPGNEITPMPDEQPGRSFVIDRGLNLLGRFLWGMLATLAMSALALLFLLIFPAPIERISKTISTQPVLSGAVGLLSLFLLPFALLILIITIILSPFAILGVILLVIALVIGWIGLGLEVGNRVETLFHGQWAPAVTAMVGVGLITFITALFNLLWFCGALVGFILSMIGMGAVILTRFGFKDYPLSTTGTTRFVPPPFPPAPPAAVNTSPSSPAPADLTPTPDEPPVVEKPANE